MDRAFLKRASLFFAQEASDTNEKRSHCARGDEQPHGLADGAPAGRVALRVLRQVQAAALEAAASTMVGQ